MLPFSSGACDAKSFSGTDAGSCSGILSSAAPCSKAALCCSKCKLCFLLTLVSEREKKEGESSILRSDDGDEDDERGDDTNEDALHLERVCQ